MKQVHTLDDFAEAVVEDGGVEVTFDEDLGKEVLTFGHWGRVVVGYMVEAIGLFLVFELLEPPAGASNIEPAAQ